MGRLYPIFTAFFGVCVAVLLVGPLGSLVYEELYSQGIPKALSSLETIWRWAIAPTVPLAALTLWSFLDRRNTRTRNEWKLKLEEFSLLKPATQITPEDFGFEPLDPGADPNPHLRPHYPAYIERKGVAVDSQDTDEDASTYMEENISQALQKGLGVILVGQPLSGKSRTIYQIISHLKEFVAVTPHKDRPVPTDTAFELLAGKQVILLLEDLNDYVATAVDLSDFCQKLNAHALSWAVASTCRDGPELSAVKGCSGTSLSRFYENIPLKLVLISPTTGEKIKLAGSIGGQLDPTLGPLFPTFGSITMANPLRAMRQRFGLLSHDHKDVLRALQLLSAGGLIPFTHRRVIAVLKHIFSRPSFDLSRLRDLLADLADQAFLRGTNRQDIVLPEPAYLLGTVDYGDKRRPKDDLPRLIPLLGELGDTGGLISLGNTHFLAYGDYDTAVACFDGVLSLNPGDPIALYNKSNALIRAGLAAEALTVIGECLRLRPDDSGAWLTRGLALHTLARHEEELLAYDEALLLDPTNVGAWVNKGLALGHLGRLEEELMAINTALTLRPHSLEGWNNKGATLRELGRFEDAADAYESALQLDPGFPLALFGKCLSLFHLGRTTELDSTILAANRIGFDLKKFCRNTTDSLHRSHNFETELTVYDFVLYLDPDNTEAYTGKIHALQVLERHAEALFVAERALLANGDEAGVWAAKSLSLVKLKRFAEALDACDVALMLGSGVPDAYLWMRKGALLGLLGRNEESLKWLRRARVNSEQIVDQTDLEQLSTLIGQLEKR